MQKVTRSKIERPPSLTGQSIKSAFAQLAAYYSEHSSYRDTRRAPIDRERIGDVEVVQRLVDLFSNKCAYCEMSIDGITGMIDYYRPLQNASQGMGDYKGDSDRYGWFAYEWRNYFLSCRNCGDAKRNQFPVTGPRAPLLCTWEEANNAERNRIVNPCEDIPLAHFRVATDGVIEGVTPRGRRTIDVFQLNRMALVEARSRKLQTTVQLLQALTQPASDAGAAIQHELNPKAAHAGIADIFLRSVIQALSKRLGFKTYKIDDVLQSLQELLPTIRPDELAGLLPTQHILPLRAISIDEQVLMVRPRRRPPISSFIHRITITNFKGISSLSLDLNGKSDALVRPPCLMLLGENATGKSTVLQAVALCLADPNLRNLLSLQPQDFLSREPKSWRSTSTRDCYIALEFVDGQRAELRIDAVKRQFEGEGTPDALVLGYGARRFHSDTRSRMTRVDNLRTLFDSSKPLVNPHVWLSQLHQDEFNAVARALREVLVLDDSDEIFRDDQGNVRIHAHGRESPLTETSEGYKSLFAVVSNIMRAMVGLWGNLEQARGIVLIDEVETHLHPRWKAMVMGALRKAFPQVQFLATTHDPLCLRGMDNGEVQVLYHSDDGTIKKLDELPNVRNLRADQLLTSDFFGLSSTADQAVEAMLDQLAASHSETELNRTSPSYGDNALDLPIGDTPFEQVFAEARRRFLREFESVPIADRSAYREQQVQEVLEALRNLRQLT